MLAIPYPLHTLGAYQNPTRKKQLTDLESTICNDMGPSEQKRFQKLLMLALIWCSFNIIIWCVLSRCHVRNPWRVWFFGNRLSELLRNIFGCWMVVVGLWGLLTGLISAISCHYAYRRFTHPFLISCF